MWIDASDSRSHPVLVFQDYRNKHIKATLVTPGNKLEEKLYGPMRELKKQ